MTQPEINTIIQSDMTAFLNKPFLGILPNWFLDGFEKAVMETPQTSVQYRGDNIQSILGKSNNELTFLEVGVICNIWLAVAPKFIDSNIRKFLVKKTTLEQLRGQWNMQNSAEQERLKRKAQSFVGINGSKIIKN